MGGEPPQPTSYRSRAEMHAFVRSQLDAIVVTSPSLDPIMNLITVLGNMSSLLFYAYNALAEPGAALQHLPVNWVGFYLMNGPQTLALGPFQGRVACTKIKVGRGVCGGAVLQGKTLVVHNVHEFPGHIACDGGSNSEVVVPIRANKDDGRIVGVLDIDSTNIGQFDAEDGTFLEEIVAVIGERLDFPLRPMTRPLGQPDTPPLVSPLQPDKPAVVHRPGVRALPPDDALPAEVVPEVHNIGGWEFQFTQQSRIQSQDEQAQMSQRLGVHAIPEIAFPINAFRMVCRRAHNPLALHVDVFAVLRDAARYYVSDEYQAASKSCVQIPASASWKHSKYETFDARIDWAWRHRYFGFDGAATTSPEGANGDAPSSLSIVEDESAVIDWDLLKRTDVPILCYASAPLFEDDLHDHGLALCTFKARVMESCFFVLIRHIIHVNGSGTSVRDVRIFHKFEEEGSGTTVHPPRVIFEEQWRRSFATEDDPKVLWSLETADALVPTVPIVGTTRFRLAS